jgi:acyl-CoA thioester hydrolase
VEGFSFSTDVRIRFAETDAQGIAHHASFVVWLEVARVAYLERHAGGYQAIRDRGIEALTTEVHVRYHRAAYFDETLQVRVRCGELRGARFTYEYRIDRGDELVADGYTRHATVDRETYRPTRVPEWLAAAIATAESSES